MAIKHLYIIRHGETEFNRTGMVQGSGVDSDLNDLGRQQAAAFYAKYNHIGFDKVYTSMLKRTWQSVAQFIEDGLPWDKHIGLNEISWGLSEGKATNADTDHVYYNTILAWTQGDDQRSMPGGESPADVASRQQPILQHILRHEGESKVLICMHGRAMRILLCQLMGMPLSQMETFMHHNLCLYQLDVDTVTGHVEMKLANEKVW
jgi:broad specificity phosphatase PhoE